ncbi:hypothetical protein GmRootV118_02780 [Variovorax sp. V118]|uniref:hypothetical protein n=1 Tax=Variovorax sp. V118 TaxID=3065954 RepID=UPI0034E8CDD1
MQLTGKLSRVIRNGYERTLEVVVDGRAVYWIGTIEPQENNREAERFVEGSELSFQIKVQFVNEVRPQVSSANHSFVQSTASSPRCEIATTVLDISDAYSFHCLISEGGPAILVEMERSHSLKVGDAIEFTGELAVLEIDD